MDYVAKCEEYQCDREAQANTTGLGVATWSQFDKRG